MLYDWMTCGAAFIAMRNSNFKCATIAVGFCFPIRSRLSCKRIRESGMQNIPNDRAGSASQTF
jgi:hypothetical protein